ncbi:MAG: amidohydrolase family protein [Myxococcota bacterium]
MQRLVLSVPFLYSPGPTGVQRDRTVVIEDGYIVEISQRVYPEAQVLAHRLLMPGLVNGHLHSEYLLFKGILEERRLSEWEDNTGYTRVFDLLEIPLDVTSIEHLYRASYLEQLLRGVTWVGEFNCADLSARVAERIQAEVGIEGSVTAKLDEPRALSHLHLYQLHHEGGLSLEELAQAAEHQRQEPNARFTLHAAENQERVQLAQRRFGKSLISLLDAYGLLSERTLLSHAVHLTPSEIKTLARTGACVVASPTGEMKLCDGVSSIPAMLEEGVTVCLGTDCASCNNDADLFLEMKTLGLLHKLHTGAHVLPAEQLLRLATEQGYRAFGITDRGRIEPGMRADLITVDLQAPSMVPMIHTSQRSNVCANLVYACTGREVCDVMIAGRWQVRHKQHLRLHHGEISAAAQQVADRLWQAIGG